jgi:hypothetical protein
MDGNGIEFFTYTFRDDVASGPVSDDIGIESPTTHAPAAPDVPKRVGYAVIGALGFAMLCFMAFFSGTGEARFMTAISLFYLTVYLAVPVVFFRIHRRSPRQVDWPTFMKQGINTWTGHLTGREAFIQIMTIPVALVVAAIAMGIVWTAAR